MTATPSTRRHGATLWRAACRVAAALRAIHDEQVLMWELFLQSSRVPVDRAGPLAWNPRPGRAPAERQPAARLRRTPDQAMNAALRLPPAEAAAAQPGQRAEPE